jgi:hypothetical protein
MHQQYLTFKIIFLTVFLPFLIFGKNIDLSKNLSHSKISILTCDPGNEIYSLFGHSALRIENSKNNFDIVVNWGLFEFSENQFQFGYDFAKGRLNYFMGLQSMSNFIMEYARSKRGVREQVLNLNDEEKLKLLYLIEENYKPENRSYRYEFFYDNCSSRIRDLLIKVMGKELEFNTSNKANKFTFREIIHEYLKYKPWLELGIDLVLGERIDVLVNNKQLMFLPDNIESALDNGFIKKSTGKNKIVLSKKIIINSTKSERPYSSIVIISWILFSITLILIYFKQNKLIDIWSITTLSILGVLGFILIFMWFGTNHQATKMNFNLLWASPFHFVLVFCLVKKNWGSFSFWFLAFSIVVIFITILFWFTLTQEFNPFVKPIILQLALIYYYYFKKCKIQINLNKTSG